MTLWVKERLPGYSCVIAYKALTYSPVSDPNLPAILRASLQLLFLTRGYHPLGIHYTENPVDTRATAGVRLEGAVLPLSPGLMPDDFLPTRDEWARAYTRRLREDRLRIEQQNALERAARPVVFQRDPEGGVDLRAFASDAQSVHRSSVQNATERSIRRLMERTVPEAQSTLTEVTLSFEDPAAIRWTDERSRILCVGEVTRDYLDSVAFSTRYSDVLDRVWAFIQGHDETRQLIKRLAQEVAEGYRMCANGKMARLLNVLQGYDESIFMEPPKEAFQEQMARLMARPAPERAPAAAALFEEYRIAEGERGAWLEALED